jgi:hypothetical protein
MRRKQQSPASKPSQSERFKEAAKALGCDDSEERFVETVGKLAKAGPQHRPARKPRAAKGQT